METFILKILFAIQGIGAASGLIYNQGALYVISDNSNYLYQFQLGTDSLDKILLLPGTVQEQVPKKLKADFEAISKKDDTFFVFGSGSSKNRNQLVQYHAKTGLFQSVPLNRIYKKLQKQFHIDLDNFNIEGALYIQDTLWLFNRGNGPKGINGIFRLDSKSLRPIDFHPIHLSTLNDMQLGFTDAIWVEDRVYFLAAAEGSNSVYLDGQVQGTIIGRLNPYTMEVEDTLLISSTHKFEGITFFQKNASTLEFLLCEDPDNDAIESQIYHLQVQR